MGCCARDPGMVLFLRMHFGANLEFVFGRFLFPQFLVGARQCEMSLHTMRVISEGCQQLCFGLFIVLFCNVNLPQAVMRLEGLRLQFSALSKEFFRSVKVSMLQLNLSR